MRIAIIAALAEELSAILDAARLEGPVLTAQLVGVEVHHGTLAGREVLIAQSGVGKVAAAATAAVLCERADAVVMVGTAGALGEGVKPGDVVVATELLQHDFDARPVWDRWVTPSIGLSRVPADQLLTAALAASASKVCAVHRPDLAELGLPAPSVHRGLIVSGDLFIASAAVSSRLKADLPDALAVELEGAAVAQICHQAGVPFAVARTISDGADDRTSLDFPTFLQAVAAPYAHDLVVGTLELLG